MAEEIDTLAGELSSQLQAIESELGDVQSRLERLYDALEKSTLTYEALSPRILSCGSARTSWPRRARMPPVSSRSASSNSPRATRSRPTSRTSGASLEEGTFPERKALIRNFVKGVEVAGDEATLSYTIPMPAGGVTSERTPVLDFVQSGGPDLTVGSTTFELLLSL